ncbi:MAG: lipoprotein signal peptidase [Prevotella sp.]|nr:lipoprotein signal peptidase [Prevotella sp.]
MKKLGLHFTDGWLALCLILVLLIIDQIIKIEVKTGMCLYESIRVTDWFYIYFVENKGMAFGMTFINKVVLSTFRIVAVILLAILIRKEIKAKVRTGFIICLSMVLAGAAGNIFDSLFYGLIFTESQPYMVSSLVDIGNGYAPVMYGKVVDMFYFPIIDTHYPDWFPWWGGERFVFFSPVFNFADACISVGFVLLLLFFRKELSNISFSKKIKEETKDGA